jgi:hypothetical protein
MHRRGRDAQLNRWLAIASIALSMSCASYTYSLRTAPGPVRAIPSDYYGAVPGTITADVLKKNGWALADAREGVQTFVRAGSQDFGVSEAEAIVSEQTGGPHLDFVRLRYSRTRLATYKALVQTLVEKYGPPQASDVRPSFPAFVLDPRSERPRPPRVVVHRWNGPLTDLVLVGGLEDEENLKSAMDYQLFLMPPSPQAAKKP